eukprot:COSAG02_NODE_5697_length_4115_cov_4.386205_1_plen_149_part_00
MALLQLYVALLCALPSVTSLVCGASATWLWHCYVAVALLCAGGAAIWLWHCYVVVALLYGCGTAMCWWHCYVAVASLTGLAAGLGDLDLDFGEGDGDLDLRTGGDLRGVRRVDVATILPPASLTQHTVYGGDWARSFRAFGPNNHRLD